MSASDKLQAALHKFTVSCSSLMKWISGFILCTLYSSDTYGGGERCAHGSGGKPEGKRPLGDPDKNERIVLRWIFRKWEGVVGTTWSWPRIGTSGGHL